MNNNDYDYLNGNVTSVKDHILKLEKKGTVDYKSIMKAENKGQNRKSIITFLEAHMLERITAKNPDQKTSSQTVLRKDVDKALARLESTSADLMDDIARTRERYAPTPVVPVGESSTGARALKYVGIAAIAIAAVAGGTYLIREFSGSSGTQAEVEIPDES